MEFSTTLTARLPCNTTSLDYNSRQAWHHTELTTTAHVDLSCDAAYIGQITSAFYNVPRSNRRVLFRCHKPRYSSWCRCVKRQDLVFTRPTDEAKPSLVIVASACETRRVSGLPNKGLVATFQKLRSLVRRRTDGVQESEVRKVSQKA